MSKKKNWIVIGTVGWVAWMFLLFIIAGLRGQDVNEMISDFIPDWELYSNIFWLILGIAGVIFVLVALFFNIKRAIKGEK